jgi:hypothetical protein
MNTKIPIVPCAGEFFLQKPLQSVAVNLFFRVRFKRERNVTVATARLAKKNLPSSSVIPKTPSIEKQL